MEMWVGTCREFRVWMLHGHVYRHALAHLDDGLLCDRDAALARPIALVHVVHQVPAIFSRMSALDQHEVALVPLEPVLLVHPSFVHCTIARFVEFGIGHGQLRLNRRRLRN